MLPLPLTPTPTPNQVKLVLANHKMVHESLNRSYGYGRIELWPAELGVKFEKALYERMLSCLYEDPQYLAALLRRAEPHEADLLVDIITQRLYSNHYKARDLSLHPKPHPNPNPNP